MPFPPIPSLFLLSLAVQMRAEAAVGGAAAWFQINEVTIGSAKRGKV